MSSNVKVLPIRNRVLFPGSYVRLTIGKPKSVALVETFWDSQAKSMKPGSNVLICTYRPNDAKDESKDSSGGDHLAFYRTGTLGRVVNLSKVSPKDGKTGKTLNYQFSMLVEGVRRAHISSLISEEPYTLAKVTWLSDQGSVNDPKVGALSRSILVSIRELLKFVEDRSSPVSKEVKRVLDNISRSPPGKIADLLAAHLDASVEEKQRVLEETELEPRLTKAYELVSRNVEMLRLTKQVQSDMETKLRDAGREYFLKQQLRAIQDELRRLRGNGKGEEAEGSENTTEEKSELELLTERLEEANLPEEARSAADRELKRMSNMQPSMPDYASLSNYLGWLADLPWSKHTKDNLDVKNARDILDKDHYALEKVKQRIVEFLAVRSVKSKLILEAKAKEGKGLESKGDGLVSVKGPILCLVGPPGVGKTSLGQSVARALGREFRRIALGGVHDEAEIRGHRRTYIGSMPGRIIQALKKVGTKNPVILLDEIDKLGKDVRGDPGSALLEVLDPEQNHTFTDHYMNVPFDLSNVLFLATANRIDTIPAPVLDRMEVIEIPGYTSKEKSEIATRHLVPKLMEMHGISTNVHMDLTNEGLDAVIQGYTREAGVRNLEKCIAALCRNVVVQYAEKQGNDDFDCIRVTREIVEKVLGPPKFESEVAARVSVPGVATGMAWTQVGGEILFVEASVMRGSGQLKLTGKLGQVMEESVKTALSFVRSNVNTIGLSQLPNSLKPNPNESNGNIDETIIAVENQLRKMDLHVHFPAGAVPKDGPSAGVAITASIVSALSERCVRKDTACTGEVTLHGLVLPVGGIKEKLLAAHRAGLTRAVLPKRNEKDLVELPKDVRNSLDIVLVDNVIDALENLLEGGISSMKGVVAVPRWLQRYIDRQANERDDHVDTVGPVLESKL